MVNEGAEPSDHPDPGHYFNKYRVDLLKEFKEGIYDVSEPGSD